MLVVPPRDVDPGRGAIYFISVKLNLQPFAPLSYVTTVHRGSDSTGEFVGEFECVVHISVLIGQACLSDASYWLHCAGSASLILVRQLR